MSDSNSSSSLVMRPLSPTYMPYFQLHRSPSNSSSNTRQREDYEPSFDSYPNESPSVLVTSSTDLDDEDLDVVIPRVRSMLELGIDGYPAWELPFASEPALETELEQELPPLKKLKSVSGLNQDPEHLSRSPDGIVVLGAVKGILTRRDAGACSGWSTPAAMCSRATSPTILERCFPSWALGLGPAPGLTTLARPLSRRSSSGASSAGTGASLKAVRFASGNGFVGCWTGSEPLPKEVEGPVAAVMYLTHSAEAYDRSPIVVEDGLRLPPRAKKEDHEGGGWMMCQAGVAKPKHIPNKARLARVSTETIKPIRSSSPCSSPTDDSDHHHSSSSEEDPQEASKVAKSLVETKKAYREIVEEEDEDDEEEKEDEGGDDDEAPETTAADDDESDEEEDNNREDRMCGFGKWSSGEVFGSCDALGGF